MKNITLSIDDETHRQARIRAAEMGTSVSALVRGFLQSLGAQQVLLACRHSNPPGKCAMALILVTAPVR